MSVVPRPRSVRNNNPGNIERNSICWVGLAPIEAMNADQKAEPRFCVFIDARYGFRALAVLLLGYWQKRGLCTVAQIIARFAPSNENNTQAYVRAVCAGMGVEPATVLDMLAAPTLKGLARAIATHEAGGWLFEAKDLDAGIEMALGPQQQQPAIS